MLVKAERYLRKLLQVVRVSKKPMGEIRRGVRFELDSESSVMVG